MQILTEHKLKYLNRRLIEITELEECLLKNNFEMAGTIGHRLKGNGETFGFPLISMIGISLERAALAKDKLKLKESIEKLIVNVEENLKKIQPNGHI